jgi:hypothetical protein
MALARVVSFDGVSDERIAQLRDRIGSEQRPDDIPASEMLLLHDSGAGSALAIMIFENEDDYRTADRTLNAMPADETPGSRASVGKYDVAVRVTSTTA